MRNIYVQSLDGCKGTLCTDFKPYGEIWLRMRRIILSLTDQILQNFLLWCALELFR